MSSTVSRLSLEIDSRSAEQKVADMRRALEGLNEAGLRANPALAGAAGGMNSAGNGARSAQAQVNGLERQMKSLAAMASGIAGPLAAAFSVKALYDAVEAYTSLNSRMKLVTETGAQLAEAQKAVFQIAQSAYQPLTATAELYQRIASNQKELGINGKQVAGVVGTISKTLSISGASAASANAALIQLGQAFASGVLRGEELNSVMEQAPALSQAIARGMGITVGELRKFGAEGKLTADAVVKALQSQESAVESLFNKTNVTIGNSLTALGNSATRFVGELDQFTGSSAKLSAQIVELSKSIDGSLSGTLDFAARNSSELEQLMTTGLYVALARVAGGFAQQAASAAYSAVQTQKASSSTAEMTRILADREKASVSDTRATLANADASLAATKQQQAANIQAAESELQRRKSTLASIESERAQAQQRVRNALSEEGRIAAQAKLDDANRRRVQAISQVTLAERNLANSTTAATAQIKAAYDVRTAAAAQARDAAIASSVATTAADKAAAAASLATRAAAGLRAGILSLTAAMGGPLGLLFITGAIAASFIDFGGKADEATKALDQQGLTVDEITRKYDLLNASQQRIKRLEWVDEQKETLKTADEALKAYLDRVQNGALQGATAGIGIGKLTDEFNRMIGEVRSGQRDLDSVNEWLKQSINLTPQAEKALANSSSEYTKNIQRNKELGQVLDIVNKSQKDVAASANESATAQGGSAKQTKAQTAEIEKYLAKLREQVTLYGASKERIAEYEASKLGMNAQQKQEAVILGQIQVVQEKYQEALKKNDAARKESLRVELTSLITQRNANQEAADKAVETATKTVAAITRIHYASDKAAADSVTRRMQELSRLATFADSLPGKTNFLVPVETNTLAGNSMRPQGTWKPTGYNEPVKPTSAAKKTVAEEVAELTKQIEETTNASNRAAKAYTESAGQKMLNQASEQAAVLREQSLIYDKQVGQIEKIGPEQQKLIKWEQELSDIKSKKTLTADQKSLLANQDQITAALKANAAEEKRAQIKQRNYELDQKAAEFAKSVAADLALAQQGLDNELSGVGLGQEGRKRLQEDLKIRQDYQKKMDDLQEQLSKGEIDKARYDKQTAILEDALAQRLVMQERYYKQLEQQQSNWANGANSAWQDYVTSAKDIAGQTYDVFSNAFSGMEDALLEFVMTGKLSFKELANSIISDIARIIIRTQVVAPLLNAVFGGSGGSGGGIGSMFSAGETSGGGFSVTQMISGAKTVVEVAGSKFGQSVMSGWEAGGDSVIDSLTGAIKNGGSYVYDAVTSAFSAGSQTASVIIADGVAQSAGNAGAAMVDLYSSGMVYNASGEVVGSAASMTTTGMSSTLGTLSAVLSYIQGAYSIFQSFEAYGIKGAAVTGGAAAAGAYAGSFFGPIGTAVGFAIGAALGAIGADKWFGTGEKYEELASSASGTYSNGVYTDRGWVEGWKEGATRFGSAADAQLQGYATQFTTTLGMLYETLGNGADVATDLTMRRRRTSGNYSSTFEATLDNGQTISHLAEYGGEIEDRLNEFYDDYMGTFLAKAIVGSESLPAYFKAQFTKYADDWDVTAETVIAAIEGVFTRFNGVNSALERVHVAVLDMGETGLIASDSILNMVAKIADLDVDEASAKDKVKALEDLVNGYYGAFFSADEQFADLTKSLETSFARFGLTVPDVRSSYRQMVEDIDVTTEAGQAMFATFMGLATAADSYYSKLEENASNYYDLFTSDDQKSIDQLASVRLAFQNLGAEMPATRDAFVAMVEAAKKGQVTGQATADALMALASSADTAYQALTSQLVGSATSAFAAVQRAVNAEKTKINESLSDANSRISELTSIASSLDSALQKLRGTSDESVKVLRNQAQATLQSALAIAKAGGSLSGFEGLTDALDVLGSNTTDMYSSLVDFNRDQGVTANAIADLEALNGKQLTNAQKTVVALEAQLDALDSQLEFAQSQLDALNGVDNSVKSVADAIKEMNAAVVAAIGTITGKITAQNAGTIVDTIYKDQLGRPADESGKQYWVDQLTSGSLNAGNITGAINNAAAIEAAYAAAGISMNSGASYWATQLTTGAITLDQLKDAVKNAAIANGSIPAFASGGMHAGGIRLVGERGPELEVTGPSRIFSASKTAEMLGGGDSAALASAIEALMPYLWQISKNTGNSEAFLRQAVQSGLPISGPVQVTGTVTTEGEAA